MAKYKITKCVSSQQLVGTEFEGVIIKPVVKVIHNSKKHSTAPKWFLLFEDKLDARLVNLENRMTNVETILKHHGEMIGKLSQKLNRVITLNNLKS